MSRDKRDYKRINRIYYRDLQQIHQLLVPSGLRVLEIGSRYGDTLASFDPIYGVGVELDTYKYQRAKEQYEKLNFFNLSPDNLTPESIECLEPFDIIILNNVLNTAKDVHTLLENIHKFSHSRTRLIINFHNWLWQPFLKIAEKIGQREPQPPESWLTPGDVKNLLDLSGWQLFKQGHRFIIPRQIPLVTSFFNQYISQLPFIEHLGLTHWMVAKPNPKPIEKPSVSVIIPARNEEGNITSAISRLSELGKFTEVIFVEGHSTDNTWSAISNLIDNYRGPLRLSKYQQTGRGKADAVWLGFEKAKGEILIILDADLTVRPEDLSRFVQALSEGTGDFINGCRLVYPRSKIAMPYLNTFANRFFAAIFSWLLRQRIKDTLCGTKVLWNSDYQLIKQGRSYFGNFDPFGDFDLLFGASKLNLKIVELPIRYQERIYGDSNIAHLKEGLILGKMCLIAAKKLRFTP
ncbi:glycosyltransferase [Prochlorococcus marinus]|uniref:glycosyltransferase n=1 Tax=Prochlorococcus marinus TaxID=1219 RepID=UPI0022B2EAD7|nr:glycosyltransferase [Prochlorococcus marinus]